MLTIIVFVMTTTNNTARIVLSEMLLKEAKKDLAFYSKRAEVEGSKEMQDAEFNARLAVTFYEAALSSLS